jgi:acetylornithine deacetylase/succinyl-diaminopimelate desuccinylase-like protein
VESAKAVASLLKEEGLENVKIISEPGVHPYVYGDWLHAPGKPTLLLYAHHDVQPPGRTELWKCPPFEPKEIDGRLFGRGTADDKAGILVHSSTIRSWLKTTGKLPVNVKMLIEGEEEIGSANLEKFLQNHKDLLKADVIVLTDTANYDTGIPTITTSLRGLVACTVEVNVMKQPLHSGSWGGPLPDPILALSKMLASLVDDKGKIAIPGIMEMVRPMTQPEKDSIKELGYTEEDFKKQVGLKSGVKTWGDDISPLVKMTRLPSVSVNAIQSGNRSAPANIINETAWCKVGIRIVPDMDPKKTLSLLQDHLKKNTPWGVEVKFGEPELANPWLTVPEGDAFEKASSSLTKAFGKKCVYLGCGGTIPFVAPFSKVLNAPALLIGVEDPYTNAHSENESLHLDDFRKSIVGAIYLYEQFGNV